MTDVREPQYRLLKNGEEIQKGDQSLDDDCEHWNDVSEWPLGLPYSVFIMQPLRRRLPAALTAQEKPE